MMSHEEEEVDPQLGYPLVYPKLCRHAHATGLPLMPFLEGPPQRFLPYSPQPDEFAQLKDWDTVFPVVAEKEKDSSSTRKFAEELWQQLDHLGNAGFDPAKFRVDPYGNVVYWNADPSSPLAWDVDYWFPHPRGGKTKLPNLRIVQWQAYLRKRNRLEFLVPWWDLQHGCSINQFLSAFAAKNADFRKRSFALFFAGGEDESVAREHVGECRPWPQQFREKKALCGLAAAAIMSVSKETPQADSDPAKSPVTTSDVSRILGAYPYGAILGASSNRLWSAEEEEAVKRGVSKFGPGSWKEIKKDEITLANRSVAQIKEKFRLMRGVSRNVARENGRGGLSGRQSTATTALQKELRVKIMREEERREREEELSRLEETVARLKVENERERAKAEELEALLKKHKQSVEKQRKWAESQASYRLCLERVLRDTMHQTMTYKEQARLTREACNVLIARLDSQKAACEAMEHELLQRHSQREVLEAAAAGGGAAASAKLATQGRDIVDVSSCVSLDDEEDEEEKLVDKMSESEDDDGDEDEVYNLRRFREHQVARKSLVRHAIKAAMQVEDTKEAVGDSQWDMPTKPPCPIQASRHTAQAHDVDSETPESESDSDFADDEMSPAIRVISRDDEMSPAIRVISQDDDDDDDDDKKLVSELSQFHDGPTSELREFCARNSKPGDSCVSTIEDGESDQSKQLEVVQQKDVIMVQQQKEVEEEKESTGLCKQEHIDALLQQIRFQIPTSEGAERDSGHAYMSEGHLDELLEQVLKTHLDAVGKPEIKEQQEPAGAVDDEKLKEIGKSNLDKWLQALLFKETESANSSPGRELLIPPPALSQLSMELLMHRESENADQRPRTGLWGALLRKLSVKHHEEERSSSSSPSSASSSASLRLFEPKEDYDMVDEAQNVQTAMNSLLKSSPGSDTSSTLAEGRRCNESCVTLPGWPGGNPKMGAIASGYIPRDPPPDGAFETRLRRPLSDVEEISEISETGSFTESPKVERKLEQPGHRHKRRVSIKVAGFVGWKKGVKRAESRLQPDQKPVATDVMES